MGSGSRVERFRIGVLGQFGWLKGLGFRVRASSGSRGFRVGGLKADRGLPKA